MPTSDLQAGVYASLANLAIFFVNKMKQKIDDVKAPRIIKEHISIQSPVVSAEGAYIDVVIDTSEDGAPMAGAYEWGKSPYIITPGEGKKNMAFPIGKWPNYEPPPNVSVATFPGPISGKRSVNHPAIISRPYIEPTITQHKDEMRKILAQGFSATLRGMIIERVVIIE